MRIPVNILEFKENVSFPKYQKNRVILENK